LQGAYYKQNTAPNNVELNSTT